jgi:isopentenyl phosphate kinase
MTSAAGHPAAVTLLKLGGSLLTDKTGVEAVRPAVLARLAAEIAEGVAGGVSGGASVGGSAGSSVGGGAGSNADGSVGGSAGGGVGGGSTSAGGGARGRPPAAGSAFGGTSSGGGGEAGAVAASISGCTGLVVGHGSGSFGHVAARRYGLAGGVQHPDQLPGVSLTQERAAALHRQVTAALAAAGLHPFSLAPSSSMVAVGGQPTGFDPEPLLLALDLGLLPVVYGDIVLDRRQGVAICSTERLFEVLAAAVAERGVRVARVIWLGETDGVYDGGGRTLPSLGPDDLDQLGAALGGAAGSDVTGGMRLRVETALALAHRGIPSLIANGTTPGLLAAALRGEAVPGTEVRASEAAPASVGP